MDKDWNFQWSSVWRYLWLYQRKMEVNVESCFNIIFQRGTRIEERRDYVIKREICLVFKVIFPSSGGHRYIDM